VHIGNIQIAPPAPALLQLIGPEALKTAAVLPSRGELNAFQFLLNGVLNTREVGFPNLAVPQSGNRTVNSPAPFGHGNQKESVENTNQAKDRREPPEPVTRIAEAPPLAVAQQFETKREASGAREDRLAPNLEPKLSATTSISLGNGDTRAALALPVDAPLKSLADVAFALQIFPKAAGFQNDALVGDRNRPPWRPGIAMDDPASVVRCGALAADAQHATGTQTPGSSSANPVVVNQQPTGRPDSLQIQASLAQGVVSGARFQQDSSKSENPLPVSPLPARTDSGGNEIHDSMNLPSTPDRKPVECRHSWPDNPSAALTKSDREDSPSLDSSPIPEVALSGSTAPPPSVLTQPTFEPRSGPASAQPQDPYQRSRPVATQAGETNAAAGSEARQASSAAIPPQRQEAGRTAIDGAGQARNFLLKPRQDSTETRAEMKGSEALPVKPNPAPMGREDTPHENKPDISGSVSPGIVSRGLVEGIHDIPGERGPAKLPSASNLPPQADAKEPIPPQAARQISFKLAGAASGNVNVLFTEKAGKVEVAVRTPDQNLTKSLQADLGDLVARLDASGLKAETWTPIVAHHAPASVAEPSHSGNSQGQPGNSGLWSGNQQQQRGQKESNQRQQPRWMAQLDDSLKAEDKRMEDE